MQVVGVAARASGIDEDARRDHPFAAYAALPPRVVVYREGDVWARLMVRAEEAREAVRLIDAALEALPGGRTHRRTRLSARRRRRLRPSGRLAWSDLALGRRGAKQSAPTGEDQRSLVRQLAGAQLGDFGKYRAGLPSVNKSFNLSYAGNDR